MSVAAEPLRDAPVGELVRPLVFCVPRVPADPVPFDLVQRGEYVYTACGPEGFRAYDIANLDNKGFSERIVTAPVSPPPVRVMVLSPPVTPSE